VLDCHSLAVVFALKAARQHGGFFYFIITRQTRISLWTQDMLAFRLLHQHSAMTRFENK